MRTKARERMRAGARLLRTVLHSNNPLVQEMVREACPTFHDMEAARDLLEQLEAAGLDLDAAA